MNWGLLINHTKCNYIVIGRAPPHQLSLATGSQGNSIQAANVVKDLGDLMDNSFSQSSHCKEAVSKARRLLLTIRWSLTELSVSAFAAPLNMLVRTTLITLCRPARQALLPTPIIWNKSRCWWRGSKLVSAECHTTNTYFEWVCTPYGGVASVETTYSFAASFFPPVILGLRGHPFKIRQGPSRRLRRKSSFSKQASK